MEALARAVSELYLLCARANERDEDRVAVVTLYAEKLRQWPGDLAIDAIRGWRGKFFPALPELEQHITGDSRLRERRLRMQALKAFVKNGGETPYKISDEERSRIEGGFDKLKSSFGVGVPEPNSSFWDAERLAKFQKRFCKSK